MKRDSFRRGGRERPSVFYRVSEPESSEPREPSRRGSRSHGVHKTRQLCRQVERALCLALAGECGDPILQDLLVTAVTPAPNDGRLLVEVVSSAEPADVLDRLERASGLLRRSVARAIVRKRVPELVYCVVTSASPEVSDGR